MRVTNLTVKNIGIIKDSELPIDKPEIVFYGECKQGKSTILNAVRWAFGGAFPADILRRGQTEAFVQLEGTDSDGKPWCIRREWYKAKDHTTKAREVVYTRNGVPVRKPVDAIKQHLNPFLLDQDYLRRMTALDRSKYLVELFGVDTSEDDAVISETEESARQLRIKIKMYGQIDLTPVAAVNVDELTAARQAVVGTHAEQVNAARAAIAKADAAYEAERDAISKDNEGILAANAEVMRIKSGVNELAGEIEDLRTKLAAAEKKHAAGVKWLETHAEQPLKKRPDRPDVSQFQAIASSQPDTAEIDAKLRDAGAQNVKAAAYVSAKLRAAQRDADELELSKQEKLIRAMRKSRTDRLAAIGQETGIAGLEFKEGGFSFDATDSSMLSDSQIMRLSESLSGKYPDGFGLSLLDRGESLGKSVLTLWEEAQARNATVLVTVVGDKPATVPEQVGAYVVQDGEVTK